MHMNKKLLAIMSAMFLMGQLAMAEELNALVVHLKDGTSTTFLLDDEPRATFSNGALKVVSSSLSMEFSREDVLRFTYGYSDAEGISMFPVETFSGVIENEVFLLSGLNGDVAVRLFSVDGKLLSEVRTNGDGKVNIPLDAYPSGVYVLQSKGFIHKFTKP